MLVLSSLRRDWIYFLFGRIVFLAARDITGDGGFILAAATGDG